MYENMLQNALNCTIQKKFWGCMSQKPPSKCVAICQASQAASRHATIFWGWTIIVQPPKKVAPPLGKSCIRPWTTIKKII